MCDISVERAAKNLRVRVIFLTPANAVEIERDSLQVRQPFLFGRNMGELLELRGRQTVFFKRNQIHRSFFSLNPIMRFIGLEKGIFLETFLSIQIKLRHGGFSTNLRPWIHSARSLLPSALLRKGIFFKPFQGVKNDASSMPSRPRFPQKIGLSRFNERPTPPYLSTLE
jgi:hypothetical protein